jgi:hypothetical protein
MTWQCISPNVTVKSQMQGKGLMMICCRITVKRMGQLGVSVRKMKALTVKMD